MNRRERRAKGDTPGGSADAALRAARELIRQGRRVEAEALYRKIIAGNPKFTPAFIALGISCVERGDLGEANRLLTRAEALSPQDCVPLALLAAVKMESREKESALDYASRAVALSPSPQILQRMGGLFREAGRIEQARECYEKAILLQPGYVPAYFSLGTVKKLKADDPAFLHLLSLKDKAATLAPDMQGALHFALGRAFLDQGNAEDGFHHIAEGNRLKRSGLSYDPAQFDKHIDSIIRLFNTGIVQKFAGCGVADAGPIFVVGMPRSGSTLVDQILSSHPDVRSAGEAKFLTECIPAFPNAETPNLIRPGVPSITQGLLDEMTSEMLDGIARKYLSMTAPIAAGAPNVVDKMLYNYLWIGIIRLALPKAKIIHCTRDPMDMGLSIWQLLFSDGTIWGYDQSEIGRYYLAYRRLMAHWNALFPGSIYEANYEKMVMSQEEESRRLLEFCGLPWNDAVLKFHENSRTVNTWSATQVRQPIYKDAAGRWRKYSKYLQPLAETLGIGKT